MSFFDDASLVFLPSGEAGKDGKAYSMKPTNGNGDFTFSRGSNLTSTRVDSNGLIEKGRENLLLKSNLFDNGGVSPTAWATSNASVSSGQSGYDGSSDAWLLQANSDGGGRRLQQSITQGGVSTLSIYAKAGTTDWIRIEFVGASSYVYFDLTNGVLGSETNAIGKIESIGNGWYRCSAVNTSGSTPSTMRYILASANNNVNVVTGDNIYIQDAQLEQGLVATEYIESGATTGKAGILEDSPRFDYSGGASCPSLLLEPSRTNLFEYSEYFGDGWSSNNVTITSNTSISPEGVQNATTLADTSTTAYQQMEYQPSLTAGASYAFSMFIKKDTDTTRFPEVFFRIFNGGTEQSVAVQINTQTGAKVDRYQTGSAVSDVIDFSNDYWRLVITATDPNDGNSALRVFLRPAMGLTFGSVDASATGGIVAYGLQLEQGSYPTSYIPNHSGGSVTRGSEYVTNVSIPNTPSLWSCLVEVDVNKTALVNNKTFFNTITPSGTMSWRFFETNGVQVISPRFENSNLFPFGTNTNDNRTDGRVLLRYNGGGSYTYFRSYLGVVTQTTATGLTETDLNQINFNGVDVKWASNQILVFPTALSNTDCEIITGTSYESFAAMATALNYTTYE